MAQGIDPNNLSNVRVDDLSDEQIRVYLKQAEASGLSESQMEQMALQRGMPVTEIEKLRERIQQLKGGQETPTRVERPVLKREVDDSLLAKQRRDTAKSGETEKEPTGSKRPLPIFGSSLFQEDMSAFEPNLRLATPKNYVIGPDDQLLIDIYGLSEVFYNPTVTPEGMINVPNVGVISVGGLTFEEATGRIRNELTKVYSAIRTGETKVSISLGNIRSINVTITGEVTKPGTYTLPSLASVFNALYYSGGPSKNGSFRNISLVRDGSTIAVLDIYDIMMKGTFSENIRLQDQDVLMVPPYINLVELDGEVRRPARFELKEGETFADLLRYAGGFSEKAYQQRIKVIKNTMSERRIEDLMQSQFRHYLPQAGDQYLVERILERFENRVTIAGAVFRPGEYELSPGLTLSMLIKKAEGLKEDAFLNRAYLTRLKDDLQTEQLSFSVADVVAGVQPDIELKREDVIHISSIFDLKEEFTVRIEGEIRTPGEFDYAESMTLEDLIMQAGGYRESASPKRIEISRRVRDANALSASAKIAEVFQVDADRELSKSAANFVLMPFDLVVIRTESGYETQKTVRIEGEVLYPGKYTILRKDERISDLIKRAGGFTPYAHIEGASLKRGELTRQRMAETEVEKSRQEQKEQDEYSRMLTLEYLQKDAGTASSVHITRNLNNDLVGINLERIVTDPGKRGDLILEDGDVIRVPKELQTVKISGEVLAPSTAVYAPSKGFKQYISQAGGFSQRALRKGSYIIYANGMVKSTNRFLFFNNYPPVKPGSEIFIPQAPERLKIGPQQWIGMTTGLASLMAIIVTITR
uniref:SLBB domain-containing protein n=1 Tax=Parapedobacter tibetensis TaxID=2972951 RepID=UPI00214DB167|nr:SLBB domain-containing protein [Parapedobacter tibetensis]